MVRGGALHSRPPGRLPKRPRPQVHEKRLVPRRKGFCIQASISAGPVELQLGSSQARSGFLWPMRSVLSVHHMHVRTRGRPPHAHTCGAAFGMRGVSGMPRVSGRAWLRGDGGCGLRGGGARSEWCGAGRCTPDPLAASRSDHVHRSMKRGSSLGARALHPGLDLD